jgi:hypothetical protein
MLVSWRTGTLNSLFFDATVTHGRRGWDFYALYQAGHNVLTGHSVYESDGSQIDMVIPDGTYTPFRYLPLSAYTVGVLLNLVSPLWAYRLWATFTEVCLLACAALTWRTVKDRDRRARLVAMWLCYTPFYLELYMGQFSFVQGALVFVMLLLALRSPLGRAGLLQSRLTRRTCHPERSGAESKGLLVHPRDSSTRCRLLGMTDCAAPVLGRGFDLAWIGSVLWKQNTALFLPLMLRLRRWRALGLLALLLLVTAGPYFALVPHSLDAFLGNFRSEAPWFQFGNLGFRQLVFDAMWSAGDVLGVEIPASLYAGVQTAVVALFLCVPLALTVLDRRPDVVAHLCLWMSTYYLVYHHVWEHHYVMILPVLVILAMRERSPWLGAIYVLLALPTPFRLIDPQGQVAVLDAMRWTPIRPLWQDLVYHASKAVPVLALYCALAWRIAHPILQARRSGHVASQEGRL